MSHVISSETGIAVQRVLIITRFQKRTGRAGMMEGLTIIERCYEASREGLRRRFDAFQKAFGT